MCFFKEMLVCTLILIGGYAADWAVCVADVGNVIFNSEEAQRMWLQQEEKWNLECEARERLMTEVLVTLQRQLEEKLEANLAEQRDLVKNREELVARVEQANAELKEESAELKQKKEAFKKEIDIQVRSWQ
jgi:cell envelope opacity-associated protein A